MRMTTTTRTILHLLLLLLLCTSTTAQKRFNFRFQFELSHGVGFKDEARVAFRDRFVTDFTLLIAQKALVDKVTLEEAQLGEASSDEDRDFTSMAILVNVSPDLSDVFLTEALAYNCQLILQDILEARYISPDFVETIIVWNLNSTNRIMDDREVQIFQNTLFPALTDRLAPVNFNLLSSLVLTQIVDDAANTGAPVNRVYTPLRATCDVGNKCNNEVFFNLALTAAQVYAPNFRLELKDAASDNLLSTNYFSALREVTAVDPRLNALPPDKNITSNLLTQQEQEVASTPLGFWLILGSNILILVATVAYIYTQRPDASGAFPKTNDNDEYVEEHAPDEYEADE